MREKRVGKDEGLIQVRVWLRLLSYSINVEKRLRRRMAEEFDTTLPRFDVLAALERAGDDGLTMGELSSSLLVSNGNVTSLIKQLKNAGWVSSQASPNDARKFIAKLTNEGREAFREQAAAHHDWIQSGMAHMPSEKLEALYQLLDDLKNPKDTDRR